MKRNLRNSASERAIASRWGAGIKDNQMTQLDCGALAGDADQKNKKKVKVPRSGTSAERPRESR